MDVVLASLQMTNCGRTATLTEVELALPASLHLTNCAMTTTEAGLALIGAPATTQEPKDGVLASLQLLNSTKTTLTTTMTEAEPALPASLQFTNYGTMTNEAGLALPAAPATTLEPKDGVLTSHQSTNILHNEPVVVAPTMIEARLEANGGVNAFSLAATKASLSLPVAPPMTLLPKVDHTQYQRRHLTNKDGLVILDKSDLLTQLRCNWRQLLTPGQILYLCFFFECPTSHQDYNNANTNDTLDHLSPFSPMRWKYMTEIHCGLEK
jgi:hypothetical protein